MLTETELAALEDPPAPKGAERATIPDKAAATGRQGDAHPNSTLTDAQVLEIRKAYARGGVTMQQLSVQFEVGTTAIWKILNDKTGKHLPGYCGPPLPKGMAQAITPGPAAATGRRVALPKSSDRKLRPQVYVRIVRSLSRSASGAIGFDGKIYAPGAVIGITELQPPPAVVIECAGPIGIFKSGKPREFQYIAWRFDFKAETWFEIARAQAHDSSWTAVLREAVRRVLYPENPDWWNTIRRSAIVRDELLQLIDNRLENESNEVRKAVLDAIYEQVAGRIVELDPTGKKAETRQGPFPTPEGEVNSAVHPATCPPPVSLAEDQQDGAAALPKPKPIQRETRPRQQQDGGAIQIGPRLWWVAVLEPKPIQRETRGLAGGQQDAAIQIGQRLWA